ncbi:MAG: ATP-binding cassette domain-containing protein [Cyanobacteria bacterium J055]|nr:MAG: ATP-binding cassette domain-containing protein [Cyanobacteria bacterium J055]
MNTRNEVKSMRQSWESTSVGSALLKLFAQIQADPELATNSIADLTVEMFALGDELPLSPIQGGDRERVPNPELDENFYLICEGRVRLLAFDPERQREVSSLVLEAGELLKSGQGKTSNPHFIPYRAIAASDSQIARIAPTHLRSWFDAIPQLKPHIDGQTQRQQFQLFFKTQTELRSLPSSQLQQLFPYCLETQIDAGTPVAEATPAAAGRFWLRGGQIRSSSEKSLPAEDPPIGTAWGYPDETPSDWLAQTDVWTYQLPREHWDKAIAIAPMLAGNQPADAIPIRAQTIPIALSPRQDSTTPAPLTPKPGKDSIIFPKPIGRRILDTLARYPYIQQQSSSDRGAACLAIIGQYWGKRFSLNLLRELAGVGRSGASLKNLAKAAETLGFQARPVRASLNKIAEHPNPWIAHWQGIHYVVIYKVEKRRVLVADPAEGKRWFSRQDMLENWTGYALLLDPTDRLKAAPTEKRSLGKFAQALLPYRNLALQIIAVSILLQVFALISPLFTQIILDQVVVQKSQRTLTIFCLGALLFGIGGMALSGVRQYLLAYLSNQLNLTLVSGFISHTLTLPLKFFESRRVGDILTRVQENQKIQRFLIGQVMLAWLNFVTGMIYLGLMLYYNVRLTLLVLGLIPPMVIFTLLATPLLRKLSRERFSAAADQNSSMVEMMTGVSTLKASASERELRWRWEDRFTTLLNVGFKGQKLGITLGLISGFINSVGGIALLWYGCSLVIQGELTIGQYVAFNMMKGYILSPVMALIDLWDELQEVWISVERLNDVFGTEAEEPSGSNKLVLPRLVGEVRFDNVTFRYTEDEERNTLQNISFEVKPGQTIAIVGRSGSGKSTLVKLLQGLYHPTQGRVLIDGHDTRHISPQSLRSQLGVVAQDCFLFSGTIAENITIYNEEISFKQVVEAAKLAEAHAFIQDMPLGYNTQVGERGTSLSGGQQQRIAIARALLGEPRILVLDEATSSLDTESERRFQQNLARISRDRTAFIIAHRLSTVRNADCILVLDRGLLVEQGTHEQLMALQGLYYHLAQQQLDL